MEKITLNDKPNDKAKRNAKKQFKRKVKNQTKQDYTRGGISNVNYFRKGNRDELLPKLRTYHKITRDKYLTGLIHPDLAVTEGQAVKMYSDVPIPTSTVGIHEQYQFTPSANGTFLISWMPNFLCTASSLSSYTLTNYSHLTYNNNIALTGSVSCAGNLFTSGAYIPQVDLTRTRLVSALLKVSYNGPVLNQSGTMLAAATFDPFFACAGSAVAPVTGFSNTLADRYGNFALIQNGLWPQTTNITNSSEGLECLYIPIDPMDLIFEKGGTYHGLVPTAAGILSPPTDGAPINYVIAGRNFSFIQTCVIVDLYYNYEVIPDPNAVPIMRPIADTSITKKDHEAIMERFGEYSRSGGLIKRSSPSSGGWSEKFSKIMDLGIRYLPMIMAAL